MGEVKLPIKKGDLQENKPVKADVNGKSVMLVMIQGQVFAIDSVCSHRGGPLENGLIEGFEVKCPWHGAMYDVRTGKVDPKTTWGKMQTPYKVMVGPSGELTINV